MHAARSGMVFAKLAESESKSISVFLGKLEPVPVEKKIDTNFQQKHLEKKIVRRQERAGKQDAIAPIIMDVKPYYFRTEQLSVQPIIVHDVDLPQDPLLTPLKIQTAILRIFVNENGSIDDVLIQASQLPEVAEEILKDTFAKIIFQPGMIDGLPVRTEMTIEVSLANLL